MVNFEHGQIIINPKSHFIRIHLPTIEVHVWAQKLLLCIFKKKVVTLNKIGLFVVVQATTNTVIFFISTFQCEEKIKNNESRSKMVLEILES